MVPTAGQGFELATSWTRFFTRTTRPRYYLSVCLLNVSKPGVNDRTRFLPIEIQKRFRPIEGAVDLRTKGKTNDENVIIKGDVSILTLTFLWNSYFVPSALLKGKSWSFKLGLIVHIFIFNVRSGRVRSGRVGSGWSGSGRVYLRRQEADYEQLGD